MLSSPYYPQINDKIERYRHSITGQRLVNIWQLPKELIQEMGVSHS